MHSLSSLNAVARLTNAFLLDACLSTSQIGSHSFQHEKRSSFTYTSNKLALCVDGLPFGIPAFPKGRRPIHRAARGPLDERFPSRRLPINERNWKRIRFNIKNVQDLHTPQISWPCASMAFPLGRSGWVPTQKGS